jgi:hypothetical protein
MEGAKERKKWTNERKRLNEIMDRKSKNAGKNEN